MSSAHHEQTKTQSFMFTAFAVMTGNLLTLLALRVLFGLWMWNRIASGMSP